MRYFLTLLLCAAPIMANPMVLEDFTDGAAQWRYFSDRVMGGVSDGQASIAQDGDMAFAQMRGTVSTANNGGFIQIRRDLKTALPAESDGITLTVRGSGDTYFIHLRTPESRRPWQYFSAQFPTGDDWTDVTLRWADFTPQGRGFSGEVSPEDIQSIGIVAYGKDFTADLSIAKITILE